MKAAVLLSMCMHYSTRTCPHTGGEFLLLSKLISCSASTFLSFKHQHSSALIENCHVSVSMFLVLGTEQIRHYLQHN